MERIVKFNGKTYTESQVKEMTVSEITYLIADIYTAITNCTSQVEKLLLSNFKGKNNEKIAKANSAKRKLATSVIWIGNIKKQKNIQLNDNRMSIWRQCVLDVCDNKTLKKIEQEYIKRMSK